MSVPYDVFIEVFLDKSEEYSYIPLEKENRNHIVEGFLKRACSQFNHICSYNLIDRDDIVRVINTDIPDDDIDEVVDIVTEGMLVQWMKPYVYKQENYENMINTSDYSGYSPAELLKQISSAYKECKKDFRNMMKDYSYNHGDLSDLHL